MIISKVSNILSTVTCMQHQSIPTIHTPLFQQQTPKNKMFHMQTLIVQQRNGRNRRV